ncbi:MAG TPA: FAD-dependent oxidoreductase [Candidatus Paceibacterota bacterium]
MHDLIIVGGGPAGSAAAVYAARKNLKTIFITNEWGGQSAVSSEIQNWIGTPAINGADLADNLKKHVEAYRGEYLEIRSPALAKSLKTFDTHVEVTLGDGTSISALTLIVASGAERRKLEVAGAAEFDQKGLTYCASCDGPLFADMDVAVIGGGNAAFETSLQLLAYCKTVTLFNRTETFRADEITIASARAHPHMRVVVNAEPLEVLGDKFVNGFTWKNSKTGEIKTESVSGIFVEIGLLPNTVWTGDALEKNPVGQVKVDPRTQRASHPRVWAAGDCTDGLYHQNNIAAGDAVKALEDVYLFLRKAKSEV